MLQSFFHPRIDTFDETSVHFSHGDQRWRFGYRLEGEVLTLESVTGGKLSLRVFHQLLDRLWGRSAAETLRVAGGLAETLPLATGHWRLEGDWLSIAREAFYQIREVWLAPALSPVMPQSYVAADCPGGRHPLRPRLPDGLLYQKHLPGPDAVFELRRAEVERDGECFHRWQNDPRVACFWEKAWDRETLDDYLRERREDPHSEPLIGYLDGVPFAYVETYWAREDRIGPYYETDDYDHGFHLLVGDTRFLGRSYTVAWMRAVGHYLYLLDPRTQRLVGEPRADNRALLRHIPNIGWRKIREFDFPHKRAMLVMSERERFFREVRL